MLGRSQDGMTATLRGTFTGRESHTEVYEMSHMDGR